MESILARSITSNENARTNGIHVTHDRVGNVGNNTWDYIESLSLDELLGFFSSNRRQLPPRRGLSVGMYRRILIKALKDTHYDRLSVGGMNISAREARRQ